MSKEEKIDILKQTQGICPRCFRKIDTEYILKEGKIYFRKFCPEHKTDEVLISSRASEYRELFSYYSVFGLDDRKALKFTPDQISIFSTTRCNLKCPVCFADCGGSDKDMSVEEAVKVIRNFKHKKINILGGEPTVYPELFLLIKRIIQTGNFPILFTNGIKLTDDGYLERLKRLGVKEVHLQFDGVDDNVYRSLRNRDLLRYKSQALEKLNRLNFRVVLEVLIDKRFNSQNIGDIINFAVRFKNIKGINFRTYFVLGKKEDRDGQLILDDLLQLAEEQSQGRITINEISEFQRLLYVFASFFGMRICLKHRFFVVYREGENNFISINRMFNLGSLMSVVKRFKDLKQRKSKIAFFYLLLFFLIKSPLIVNRKNIGILFNYLEILFKKKLFNISINKKLFRDRSLMINFERPCDNDTFDLNETCDNMVIDCYGNTFGTFYLASIEREKMKRRNFLNNGHISK